MPTMSHDIEDLVRSAYDFFNREKQAFPDLWHPDGEYINSRDDPDTGIHRGIDAIEQLTSSWVEAYPDLWVEPLEVRVNGKRAFVWTRWSGHGGASGVPIDMELAHCFTVEDEKIRRIEEYFDRAEALDAVGLD
jgi:ketosteroid isomerase-like protein